MSIPINHALPPLGMSFRPDVPKKCEPAKCFLCDGAGMWPNYYFYRAQCPSCKGTGIQPKADHE